MEISKKNRILDELLHQLVLEKEIDSYPFDYNRKGLFFRAFSNVREPKPIGNKILKLQDAYLKKLMLEKGIVDVNKFVFINNIALYQGDITCLNADAIVNACNCKLLGCFSPLHNCIDNCIHSFAGIQVRLDCQKIMQGRNEKNGQVKVTKAYNLPSKYIFHTVGPIVYSHVSKQNEEDLKNCYLSCLNKAKEMELNTIAFCCLSTGVYSYPNDKACTLAVNTIKQWLKDNNNSLKVIFNVFKDIDLKLYTKELDF